MSLYHEEQFLTRKKPRTPFDWKALGLMVAGCAILFIVMFISLCIWGAAHAKANENYTGVIKDGQIYTLSEICHGNS